MKQHLLSNGASGLEQLVPLMVCTSTGGRLVSNSITSSFVSSDLVHHSFVLSECVFNAEKIVPLML